MKFSYHITFSNTFAVRRKIRFKPNEQQTVAFECWMCVAMTNGKLTRRDPTTKLIFNFCENNLPSEKCKIVLTLHYAVRESSLDARTPRMYVQKNGAANNSLDSAATRMCGTAEEKKNIIRETHAACSIDDDEPRQCCSTYDATLLMATRKLIHALTHTHVR